MLKFYIEKEDESEVDGYARIVEFENHEDLERYLSYNRGYIKQIKTLEGGE